jgi:hypothetical protein
METMTETGIEVVPVAEERALFRHYAGQHQPQPAYVQLDCETGKLTADYNGEIGNAVPFAVWHGLRLRWAIPPLKAGAANRLLEALVPIAEKIVAGFSREWDGSNHVGRYTEAADEAIEDAREVCRDFGGDDDAIQSWDAADWLLDTPKGLTAETTDEELAALAESLEAEADASGRFVLGLARHLERLRDEMADADPVRCECGRILGERCEHVLAPGELEQVEWVAPESRASVAAAGTWRGLSERLSLAPDCAERLGDEWLRR